MKTLRSTFIKIQFISIFPFIILFCLNVDWISDPNLVRIQSYERPFIRTLETCPPINAQSSSLCILSPAKCQSKYIAQIMDRIIQFSPMYTLHQNDTHNLYTYHNNFKYYLSSIGIRTITIEALYTVEHQTYKVTSPNNEPWEFQTTFDLFFYLRENLLNIAIKKTIDLDLYDYILWIDAH